MMVQKGIPATDPGDPQRSLPALCFMHTQYYRSMHIQLQQSKLLCNKRCCQLVVLNTNTVRAEADIDFYKVSPAMSNVLKSAKTH